MPISTIPNGNFYKAVFHIKAVTAVDQFGCINSLSQSKARIELDFFKSFRGILVLRRKKIDVKTRTICSTFNFEYVAVTYHTATISHLLKHFGCIVRQ